MRVVDEHDADVPRDGATMGEVVMRGNNVMLGYSRRSARAPRTAFRGGWFHSGDLAVWHPDGTIELRDRAKDIIISGGENISTIEVEQALASHPAVLECAVVAVPHERWGERPKAFVTLSEGAAGDRGGADRALPRAPRRASRRRTPSSSGRCRRPRPARCRSSCCAIASGATARSASTDVRGDVQRALLAGVLATVLATGCLGIGDSGEYAQYQRREQAMEQIDALLATIVQYPGARLVDRHDAATNYKVGAQTYIDAEPYSSRIQFAVPTSVTGAQVQLYFRRTLGSRWRCTFKKRVPNVPYGFSCRRGHQAVGAFISDRGGYELSVQASDVVPPIRTVSGD